MPRGRFWPGEARAIVVECIPAKAQLRAQAILDGLTVADLVRSWSDYWYLVKGENRSVSDVLLDMIEGTLRFRLCDELPVRQHDHVIVRVAFESPDFIKWSKANKEAESAGLPRPDPQDPRFQYIPAASLPQFTPAPTQKGGKK